MFQINNHKELGLNDIIPYLLQFPEVYKLTEQSGDRLQIIEDIAWQLLYNLDVETASGVWLDYLGKKVGQGRAYVPRPTDAFRFGGTIPEGFGRGKFKKASALKSTKIARNDINFRNAIKAKIIENNTDTSLDELINACKLLYNASMVNIIEDYPANIDTIKLYGSSLIETLDALYTIKELIPAGVSLQHLELYKFYNLFRNDAFIAYNTNIPESNDFELSFVVKPDVLSDNQMIGLFSQNTTFASEIIPTVCFYDPEHGIVFATSPDYYNDNNTGVTFYNDEELKLYATSNTAVSLSGGLLRVKDDNLIKITRVGNTWSLYVNNQLQDQAESDHKISVEDGTQFFLGLSEDKFYNSGSIYNLLLKDTTRDIILINDPLKRDTIGNNNGVRFL